MRVWIDVQISPAIAAWLSQKFGVEASAVRDLGLRNAVDSEIFHAARDAGAVVMTKDGDFVDLSVRLGSPPQIIWVTCGNTSNERFCEILDATFEEALRLLVRGEALVEISSV